MQLDLIRFNKAISNVFSKPDGYDKAWQDYHGKKNENIKGLLGTQSPMKFNEERIRPALLNGGVEKTVSVPPHSKTPQTGNYAGLEPIMVISEPTGSNPRSSLDLTEESRPPSKYDRLFF